MKHLLYHGTPYPNRILAEGVLMYGRSGDPFVSFSRSKAIAHRFASMSRDDSEDYGAILIFDRDRLRTRYRLECFDYSHATFCPYGRREEAEEYICHTDVSPITRYMVGIEWVAPPADRATS